MAFGVISRQANGSSFQVRRDLPCLLIFSLMSLQGTSLRMLLIPVFLHINWIIFTPLVFTHPPSSPNAPLLFISYPTPSPTDDITDPRYRKGWLDLVFVAYYVVFFSFIRQSVLFRICFPIARYFGIRKEGKLARFGEQGYAILYFSFFGAWGLRIMSNLPTWWYNCQSFWIGMYLVYMVVGTRDSGAVLLNADYRLSSLADDT
jgi:acyl-CoA-dependent ceramide synthase